MNPEFYEYIMEKLFNSGARDVYYNPIYMKKNRPGIKLSVLVEESNLEKVANILLQETTTIGVRIIDNIKRICLDREIKKVDTPWGTARVKIAYKNGEIINIAPEYEDCKKIAEFEDIPLKQVYQEVRCVLQKNG
ncbi:MAG: nickel insertion protein [Halanaerobiales bacterium]